MSIIQEIKELSPDKTALRQFSWLVGGILLLIGAIMGYRDSNAYPVMLGIGGALVVVGTILPLAVKPFYYAWMSLAVVMGFVMTRVVLTVFFFLVLTPTGLFFRLIRRDALHRRFEPEASTYWLKKHYAIADRSRFEKFF